MEINLNFGFCAVLVEMVRVDILPARLRYGRADTCLVWCDITVLSEGKLGICNCHASGHCWEGFQGQRSM